MSRLALLRAGRDVVGLAPRDGRIEVAAVRRRRTGRPRLLAGFTVTADEDAAAAIRARLREAGVRARRAHVSLPRRMVVAKAIELPAVPGADLARMVRFELERHLPFPATDAVFDFEPFATDAGPVRVLLVAIERRVQERLTDVVSQAGLAARLVGVGIHGIARLLAREDPVRGRLVVWAEAAEAELAAVVGGRVVASRAFPLPAEPADARARALGDELTRTLAALSPADRAELVEVVVTGQAPGGLGWAELPVRVGGPPAIAPGGVDDPGLPALAAALERPARGEPVANLLPEELRPRPFPWPVAATAALAALTLALGTAIPAVTLVRERRALAALDAEVARLAPAVRHAEQLAGELERARREATALRGFETAGVRALPLLRELTEALPGDVWLTNLSADRNGLELAGFANAASQLISLLEGLPTLERVEFISPVTKGRDREQFRLKAAWERGPGR